MKLLQILEFLTIIVEKLAFWRRAQKREQAEGPTQTSANATTNIEATIPPDCSAQNNAEASASPTKKASLGTKKREGAHEK